jgi:hypothetical protein
MCVRYVSSIRASPYFSDYAPLSAAAVLARTRVATCRDSAEPLIEAVSARLSRSCRDCDDRSSDRSNIPQVSRSGNQPLDSPDRSAVDIHFNVRLLLRQSCTRDRMVLVKARKII